MLRDVLTKLANALSEQGGIDESENRVVATFASAKRGARRLVPAVVAMG